MGLFEQTIFSYFGGREKRLDVNKDANGKGTFERFNEVIGKDMDTIYFAIDALCKNTHDILFMNNFDLRLLLEANGLKNVYSGDDTEKLQRLCLYSKQIIEWRGSLFGAKLLTYLLLPTALLTITENFSRSSFDSAKTFDSPTHVFDNSSLMNELVFTFGNSLSDEDKAICRKIVLYETPFDCINQTIFI
jgi:hypothetical protein